MKYLGIDELELKRTNSFNTAYEIYNQPNMWNKLIDDFDTKVFDFLDSIGLNTEIDIIFTGVGTSEYIGCILEPYLNERVNLNFRSVATTDIVSNPKMYLKNKKTLLVSFARSGDSPESVATVNLANSLIDNIYHLVITCNKNGSLSKLCRDKSNCYVYLMPEGTNDKGFAMTSSFSTMLLAAILIFDKTDIRKSITIAKNEIDDKIDTIKQIANMDHKRIIVLGSGPFKGLAKELCLKVMELSRGLVVSKYDSTLGFRHGPKAVINSDTIVFLCNNPDNYAKKYDLDLIEEIKSENICKIITHTLDPNFVSRDCIHPSNSDNSTITAILTYLVYGQIYAFYKSQYLNLTTDNPFPEGQVNRVVKKFHIYDF